ncbi:MAG: hypothetical protein AAF564_22595 [Bacteroidota bacterium]
MSTNLKGPYIEGIYRGVHLKVTPFGEGGGGTEVRLHLPEASSTPSFKKRDKHAIKRILKRFPSVFASSDRSLIFRGNKVLYREKQVRTDTYGLRMLMNYLCDLVNAYPYIIQLGGEAIPLLKPFAIRDKHPLNNMATRLLKEIDQFTTSAFKSREAQVHCKLCLTHFDAHKDELGGVLSVRYYGCRTCKQSQNYYEGLKLVLVLDQKMKDKWVQQDDALFVNRFKHRQLFDFDEVLIRNASDKDVASFAIKVGNDTNAYRAERYKAIPCTVMADTSISENTIHMLGRVFKQVKRTEAYENQPG